MPSIQKVKRLYDLCACCFNNAMLDHFCKIIKSSESVSEILLLNFHDDFLRNVPSFVCESLLRRLDDNLNLCDLKKAMFIKLYKHHYLKTFNPHFKLPTLSGFYEAYLDGMNNLVVLNLTKVCTDEILEVVGNNCPLLEVIYIVSKTESVSNKKGNELNALKLKFFVSDVGLEHLHKCKYLRKVYMDKIIRSCCGGRKITQDGLRSLLNALPNITYISYEDMGSVLEAWAHSKKLNLVHIHDNHATPEHISIFEEFCPSVKILCLSIPTVSRGLDVASNCLEQLTRCNLNFNSLVLKSFPFDTPLQRLLEFKGENLTSLLLDHESSITSQSMLVIGTLCKNLQHLAVKLLHPSQSDYEISHSPEYTKCFDLLKTLKLFGILWKPEIIFPLCIYNAKFLESLSLFNKYYEDNLDATFTLLLKKNKLSFLSHLWLLDGFVLSHKVVVNLVLGCENLKEVTFKCKSGYDQLFEKCIKQDNLDLMVKVDSFANFGYCLCQN